MKHDLKRKSRADLLQIAQDMGARCDLCPLLKTGLGPVFPKDPPNHTELIELGEGPGPSELIHLEYFVGPSGYLLDKARHELGLAKSEVHQNNAVMCKHTYPLNAGEWEQAVRCCAPRLEKQLKATDCRSVLGFGAVALRALTDKTYRSIFEWMGSPIQGLQNQVPVESLEDIAKRREQNKLDRLLAKQTGGRAHVKLRPPSIDPQGLDFSEFQILPSFHPAFALRTPPYIPILYRFMERGIKMARGTLEYPKMPEVFVVPDRRMRDALRELKKERWLGCDTETYGKDPRTSPLINIGLASLDLAVSVPWPCEKFKHMEGADPAYFEEIEALAVEILEDPEIFLCFQNAAFDLVVFPANGITVRGFKFDSLVWHALQAPGLSHKLHHIVAYEFPGSHWKAKFRSTSDDPGAKLIANATPESRGEYNAIDSYQPLALKHVADERLPSVPNGEFLFDQMKLLHEISLEMSLFGIPLDQEAIVKHRVGCLERKDQAFAQLREVAPEFNPPEYYLRDENKKKKKITVSSHHAIKALFKRLDAPVLARSKKTGAPSYTADVLTEYLGCADPLVQKAARSILDYRGEAKLDSTYLRPNLGKDRFFLTWKPWGPKSRRWSSSPNAQNIPKILRDMLIADPGFWIVSADVKSGELKMIALLSGEEELLRDIEEGRDTHERTAIALFGVHNKKTRRLAKEYRYGSNYGGGVETIWNKIRPRFPSISKLDVAAMQYKHKQAEPRLEQWKRDRMIQAEREDRTVENFTGWELCFYGKPDMTLSLNFPVQSGLAQAVVNPGTIDLWDALDREAGDMLLAQIHDDLTVQTRDPDRMMGIMNEVLPRKLTYEGREMIFDWDVSHGRAFASCPWHTHTDGRMCREPCKLNEGEKECKAGLLGHRGECRFSG